MARRPRPLRKEKELTIKEIAEAAYAMGAWQERQALATIYGAINDTVDECREDLLAVVEALRMAPYGRLDGIGCGCRNHEQAQHGPPCIVRLQSAIDQADNDLKAGLEQERLVDSIRELLEGA